METQTEPSLGLRGLIELFNLKEVSEVKKHCRDLVIAQEDLVGVILVASVGVLDGYFHARHHIEITPESLQLNEDDHEAIQNNGVGQLTLKAGKAFNKIMQTFKDRRLLSVHLFYTPNKEIWHLFYFDQRDLEKEDDNHWKAGGSHIHYSRESFLNVPLDRVWADITAPKPKLPKSVHIRYRQRDFKAE